MAVLRSPGHVVFTGDDRREVAVLVAGAWFYGEQRSWDLEEDGRWSAMVTWSAAAGENRFDRFPADHLRLLGQDTANEARN